VPWATIEQALREAGVQQVRRGTPNDPPSSGFTVVVGQPDQTALVGQRLDDLGVEGPDGLADDGYVLASGRTDEGAQAVLAGVDSDGTYYAAKTFAQLPVPLDDTFALPDVEVRDWPAMSVRGTIEGFYGTPWSHQQRLRQMDFYGDMKMNVYAYAPKDDPYHRERWDEPYPPAEIDRLAELVDRARSNHVDFIFALSPGLSICYSSDEDIDALVAKFESMYDIGVRRFNVALDDINYTDWHCPQDPERFGTGAAGAGAAQSYLLNQVVTRFADQHPDVERIQMVPTEYYNVADTAYKKALREQMDPSVVVEWTGIGVVPAKITTAQAADAVEVFGHDILVWDNYPVNDYAAGQLLLGPFNGREQGLSEHLYGLHANPMNQAEASKIPLVTVADYVWNDTAYDPQRSLRQALEYVGHGDPALVEALDRFVDVNYSSILNPQNAPQLSTRIDDFWQEYDGAAGGDRAAESLAGALEDLAVAPGVIRERIDNPLFLAETDVWLDATRLWAKAADAALRMLQAQQEGDGEAAWTARLEATAAAAQARALRDDTIPHRNAAPKVGTGVVDVFVDEALARNDEWLGANPTGAVGTSSMSTYQDNTVDRMVDGDLGTFYWSAEAAGSGDFVGVDLGQPREIEQIDIAMAKSSSPSDYIQHGVLEISADGSRWTPLGEFDDQPEISVDPTAGTEARYVRLRATAGQNEWVVVREFDVEVKGGVSRTVSGGPPPAAGSRLSAAADGDPDTAMVAARAPEADETLTVEYSVARPLSGVVVLQDPASPAAATVEVRTTDGWTALGSLDGGYTEVGADDQEVDAIRLRWAGGAPAPRIHEVIGWFAEAPTVSISPDALYVESGGGPSTATVTVAARSLQDRTGTVTVDVPAGWSADPARTQVTVARGQAVEIPVEISAPEGSTPEGDVVATLEMGSQNVAATINARLVPPVSDENIARAGVATASSVELDLPQFAPGFAIDGDSSTRWSSEHTDDEWLQVELAEPTRVGKVVLTWERACASAYQVEVSSDGEAWTTVASVPETDCGTDEVRFDSSQPVTFVRMHGLGRATEWGYSIYEFEIYPVA
jgi:hyaluronoglucosaminidase